MVGNTAAVSPRYFSGISAAEHPEIKLPATTLAAENSINCKTKAAHIYNKTAIVPYLVRTYISRRW
jgi:hypothetical protein